MKTHRVTLGDGRFRKAFCLVNGAEEMLAIDCLVQHVSITISAMASSAGTMSLANDDHGRLNTAASACVFESRCNRTTIEATGCKFANARLFGKVMSHRGALLQPSAKQMAITSMIF